MAKVHERVVQWDDAERVPQQARKPQTTAGVKALAAAEANVGGTAKVVAMVGAAVVDGALVVGLRASIGRAKSQ